MVSEKQIQEALGEEFISFDKFRPDLWDKKRKCFIELKMGVHRTQRCPETVDEFKGYESKYFPSFFLCCNNLDHQIENYPRPLEVRIYHVHTGREIARRMFP